MADTSTAPANAVDPAPPASSLLDFMLLVGRLKTTKRTGWVLRDVHLPESVSDHMYRMSLIAMVLSEPSADAEHVVSRDHLVKLALAHDLAEATVGDLTPHCGVTPEDKHQREKDAMLHIRDSMLRGNSAGVELYDLWSEYEAGDTYAAQLMKDIDKFEMILTAHEYEQAQDIQLDEFFDSTRGRFKTSRIAPLVEDLYKRRETHRRQKKG